MHVGVEEGILVNNEKDEQNPDFLKVRDIFYGAKLKACELIQKTSFVNKN